MPRWIDFDIITIMLINLDIQRGDRLVITGSNFPAKLKHDSLSLILLLTDSFLSFFLSLDKPIPLQLLPLCMGNHVYTQFTSQKKKKMYILNFGLDSMLLFILQDNVTLLLLLLLLYYYIIFLVSMFFFYYYSNTMAAPGILSRVFLKKYKLHNLISF